MPATKLGASLLGYTGTANDLFPGKSKPAYAMEKKDCNHPLFWKTSISKRLGYNIDFFDATTLLLGRLS